MQEMRDLALMRKLKAIPRKEVRFRHVLTQPIDEAFEGKTLFLCGLLKEHYLQHLDDSHVFQYEPWKEGWLSKCWAQNRSAMQSMRDDADVLNVYEQLLSDLPAVTISFYDCKGLSAHDPPATRAWALVKLCERHRGEVVQISRHDNSWSLEDGPCPVPQSQQFRCAAPYSQRVPDPNISFEEKNQIQLEYGRTDTPAIQWAAEERGAAAGFAGSAQMAHPGVPFMPNWDKQQYLCVVPCRASNDSHWRREMLCSTLGDMFKALGTEHSASTIYYFYLTRKIATRKVSDCDRRKKGRR